MMSQTLIYDAFSKYLDKFFDFSRQSRHQKLSNSCPFTHAWSLKPNNHATKKSMTATKETPTWRKSRKVEIRGRPLSGCNGTVLNAPYPSPMFPSRPTSLPVLKLYHLKQRPHLRAKTTFQVPTCPPI